MHYDALIIGAGPAGCTAARVLVQAGFKVLLIEKERIPREKACAGLLSPQAVELIENNFDAIPSGCLSLPHEALGIRLLFEDESSYDLPFSAPGLSVSRSRLDAFLSRKSGAELREGYRVSDLSVQDFSVRAELEGGKGSESVEATYLIGADGADSTALRCLRPEFYRVYAAPHLQTTSLVLAGGRAEWDPRWMGLILMKGGKGMHRLFIKEGLIGLAIGHAGRGNWRDELASLLAFLRHTIALDVEDEAVTSSAYCNLMGAGGNYNLGSGGALLAGEAAGLLDPWGLGIRLALESGRIAAESLIESLGESMTPHLRYRYRMQALLEDEMKQRRNLGGRVGDLETRSLVADGNRRGRRNRRELKRRFF